MAGEGQSHMSWFARLTGFVETSYDDTRNKLFVEGNRLRKVGGVLCSAAPFFLGTETWIPAFKSFM
jgi:hypothetical protein